MLRNRAHERVQGRHRIELEHRAGQDPVCVAMDRLDGLLARTLSEAKHRSVRRVEPVRVVLDIMFALHLEVAKMRTREVLGGHAREVMTI